MIDPLRINVVILVVAYSAALTYFSSVVSFLYKVRGRLFLGPFSRDAARSLVIIFCVFGYYAVGWFVLLWVARGLEDIESMARSEVGEFLNSNRVDVMCQLDGEECVKGKIFYTGEDDYIFYEHGNDVYSGEFHVAHKRNVYVKVGWDEGSKAKMWKPGESSESK
ncbi:hypothetical protein [Halomonas sp. PR-M31]|uniref:hypothetical protein n=1 Tax=Halomonas sp. PR-M31 TaxID=1471202 RepID=UPI0012E21FEB|nr:hypothetical protein [Halomonas sp. PR-M31]